MDSTQLAGEIRQAFKEAGISIQCWARKNQCKPATVYALLRGRTVGERGEAHRIATLLGMKSPPSERALELLRSMQEEVPAAGSDQQTAGVA